MSEFETSLPSSDDPEWIDLVLDVEGRFEALNEALADLRSAIVRLSSYRPQLMAVAEFEKTAEEQQEVAEEQASPELSATWHEEDGASAELEPEPQATRRQDEEAENDGDVAPWSELADDDDDSGQDATLREEVSRIVAEARQELHGTPTRPAFDGSWAAPHDDSTMDSTSEGSWPMARQDGPARQPAAERRHGAPAESAHGVAHGPPVDVDSASDDDDWQRREEVARMVAEMRAGLVTAGIDADKGAPHEEGWSAEAQVQDEDEWSGEAPSRDQGQWSADVQMRDGEEWSGERGVSSSGDAEVGEVAVTSDHPGTDDEARRESVAEMVARMRAQMAEGAPIEDYEEPVEPGPDAGSDVDVRNEVRRAVEAARAEMASGWVSGDDDETAAGEPAEKKHFSFPDWQNAHIEPSGPPVIVIKDPEGRVELARVYETLSRVNCDENAALLNYTPHSVTVGLNLRAHVPSKESMEQAIETVFGRKCRVESDGVRVSVDLGRAA